jgi:hypothetical protein
VLGAVVSVESGLRGIVTAVRLVVRAGTVVVVIAPTAFFARECESAIKIATIATTTTMAAALSCLVVTACGFPFVRSQLTTDDRLF